MDYLIFKRFISIETLIVFYYIGAIILPVGLYMFSKSLIKKYKLISESYLKGKDFLWELLNKKQKIKLIGLFILFFIFAQLLWRMLFEFLIAFMQMRDSLFQLTL
jgi:Domain of unknown function (DUF4282)